MLFRTGSRQAGFFSALSLARGERLVGSLYAPGLGEAPCASGRAVGAREGAAVASRAPFAAPAPLLRSLAKDPPTRGVS